VQARINDAGTGLDVINLTAATSSPWASGGNTSELLGIRSFYAGTLLSSLNGGQGVARGRAERSANRLRDGRFDVALTGAVPCRTCSIGQRRRPPPRAAVTARCPTGNGIQLRTQRPAGTSRSSAPISPASTLGFSTQPSSPAPRWSARRRSAEADSMFSALLNLHAALVRGHQRDYRGGDRIDSFITSSSRLHGVVGQVPGDEYASAIHGGRVDSSTALLSEVKDLDYTEPSRASSSPDHAPGQPDERLAMLQLSLMDFIGRQWNGRRDAGPQDDGRRHEVGTGLWRGKRGEDSRA